VPPKSTKTDQTKPGPTGKGASSTTTEPATTHPGPLVSAQWLTEHRADPDLRLVHVSPNRRIYNRRHIEGATYSDLHKELALRGTAMETGAAEREWLVPSRQETEQVLRCWRVGLGDLVLFLDDVVMFRLEIRGSWLLRLYGFPTDLVHILDGGIEAWRRAGGETTKGAPGADGAEALPRPVSLRERDDALIATYEQVLAWSREAAEPDGPTRILDVRTAAEWVGADLRSRRGGHIPGARQRCFVDLLTDEGTFRGVDEMVSLVRASGAEPAEIRATYCQGGVRAALVWFVLHELAGYEEVRSYAGSWEEWGNRADSPIDSP
jgi:thiosulfate/3-mercaptopyruvate sulfurtransferase